MWNRHSWLLYVRIRLRDGKKSQNLLLLLALFVPHQLLLAWGGLAALIPGAAGRRLRLGADTIHSMLLQLMYAQPQTMADIDLSQQKQRLRVVVRTVGAAGGANK